MYICVCNAVTQNDIKEAVKEGKSSVDIIKNKDEFDRKCIKCMFDVMREINKNKEKGDDE